MHKCSFGTFCPSPLCPELKEVCLDTSKQDCTKEPDYCLKGDPTDANFRKRGSPSEIPCPDGTYGSGAVNNFDVDSACNSCGRGLYSTLDKPNECLDCTAGYVCKGRTSSATPLSLLLQRGYKCPLGHYCPKGSYEETPCPVGRYSKYMGLKSLNDCIKCKVNFYND